MSQLFRELIESEKIGAVLLLLCTLVSLALANSVLGEGYLAFWQQTVFGLSIEHWINDALMAVFFLLVGLELERELYVGELSRFRDALLPICAAIGGIVFPAGIHYLLNAGTPTQAGAGIPMATDIAFALGALALLGKRVPTSLKVFLVALAIMDDLCAIIVIAIFYARDFSLAYLLGALAVFAGLVLANRRRWFDTLTPYLIGGVVLWVLMLKSGVHATIAGVLLAFAIPFYRRSGDRPSLSATLEHTLHKPVALCILPLFALANTGVIFSPGWQEGLSSANSLGILGGLLLGKPLGIFLFTFAAVKIGLCQLPGEISWRHVFGLGCLGGIGFTMSIFITNLAFFDAPAILSASKMAIFFASLLAGGLGLAILASCRPPVRTVKAAT